MERVLHPLTVRGDRDSAVMGLAYSADQPRAGALAATESSAEAAATAGVVDPRQRGATEVSPAAAGRLAAQRLAPEQPAAAATGKKRLL